MLLPLPPPRRLGVRNVYVRTYVVSLCMRVSVSQKPGGDPTESLSKRMGMGRIRIKQQQGMALCVVVEHARSLRVCAHTHHRRARAAGSGCWAAGKGDRRIACLVVDAVVASGRTVKEPWLAGFDYSPLSLASADEPAAAGKKKRNC